jgi:WD repeat-containing protein 40A
MVFDVNTRHMDQIPSLPSSENSTPPENECGIHAIEINPSRTLLATGGKHPNDIAIYRLPTLDPICVGETAHGDWIFDLCWLDDQFVVSGSRDGTLGLWRITDDIVSEVIGSETPSFIYTKPDLVKKSKTTDRVR